MICALLALIDSMQTVNETILELNRFRLLRQQSETSFKPQFYRIASDVDRAALQKILSIPGIAVCDELRGQLTELMKLRNPTARLTSQQLEAEADKYLQGQPPEQYGVWVFYPWSNRLVHLLDEEEFIEVRTSRNQYKITPSERDLLRNKKVGVIGLSVGQSVSVTMAMERICGELRLADFDRLELTNLNRIRTGVHNLGILKVHSVAREIAELDPFIKVVCFPDGLTEQNMDAFFLDGGKLDLVVEESDGFDIKVLSRYKARDLQVPVIMEASDRCMVDVERFDLEPDRKILHGILDHLSVEKMKTLTTNEEKIPYMFDILGLDSTSAKLRASMLEMQQTITTWPQLASAVTMGGGITADVARRMMLNDFKGSGRYYVDVDELIGDRVQTQVEKKPTARLITDDEINRCLQSSKFSPAEISNDALEEIVRFASDGPSFGNEQPWLWIARQGELLLFRAVANAYPALDYKDIYNEMSLGSALERAKVCAARLGWKANVQEGKSQGLIAQISFSRHGDESHSTSASPVDAMVFAGNDRIPAGFFEQADLLPANGDGPRLSWCHDPAQISALAMGLAAAEKISILNPLSHAELFSILHCNETSIQHKGFNLSALGWPSPVTTAFRVVSDPAVAATLLKWDKGTAFASYFGSEYSKSSAFGLITVSKGQSVWQAGMLSEKIRFTAAGAGLSFQPIYLSLSLLKHLEDESSLCRHLSPGQVRELNGLKEELNEIFGENVMDEGVMLFRLGKASRPLETALRKSISDIYRSSKQPAL